MSTISIIKREKVSKAIIVILFAIITICMAFVLSSCKKEEPMGTEGLEFTLINEGYSVTGYNGSATEIFIPTTHLGKSVKSIGSRAFYDCDLLKSVTIGNGITSIGNEAFCGCDLLTSITLPNSVVSIGDGAFSGCCSIISLDIGNRVTSIGNSAFYNCSSLLDIDIPDSVFSIGELAFYNCSSLSSVTIGQSVKSIGNYAFQNCSVLSSIIIGKNVKTIGNFAFYRCVKLVEVWNKSSLNIKKGSDSYGCVGDYALNIYTNDTPTKQWTDENGYMFYEDGDTCYLLGYTGNDTELTLPSSCHGKNYEIYIYAFYNFTSLTNITISNSITSIGGGAFYKCTALKNITFNDVTIWYRTTSDKDWRNKMGGVKTDVSDPLINAIIFVTYYDYYWYKI